MGTLTGLTVERIMENGRIAAFADSQLKIDNLDENDIPVPYLTYFDFICKSTHLFILCHCTLNANFAI